MEVFFVNNYKNDFKTFSVLTLGCKVNTYESDAIRRELAERGAGEVPFGEPSDIVIVNTCAVTAVADKKSRQMLHRARTANPSAVVIATGCHAQELGQTLVDNGTCDIVVVNNLKNRIPELAFSALDDIEKNGSLSFKERVFIEDISKNCDYEDLKITEMTEHTRAFIKVQDGCNQFCAYCIIPYMRGRIRSRSKESVIEEVTGLAEKGCKEVVLTGIHLSSYGSETGNATKLDGTALADLILAVDAIDGIERVRLGSLEPRVVTEDFAKKIAGAKKLCPHFHLSLQSGSDATLKRMNRRYTAAEYREACDILRKFFDRPSLNTDIIVGFPGETEEEFAESFEFVKSIGFSRVNVFRFSRRKGTAADRMKDQIPEPVKAARSKAFIELDLAQAAEYRKQFEGETATVLTESIETVNGKEYRTGYSERYLKYLLPADTPENTLVKTEGTAVPLE
ncbi:MAG: tRNA (N(6)-L-threonylcarbamoyladenosine(37)-C(2))-methylthiotransferase MtaB [Lachnospiraceae bacterium]|nr:tRNA (N(6)-L-threonylcarbamoyladenosine(37)-C(2))-methylthiotransferase MtaB [Lachnospiraceae bacterium]